jgi:hypothetical protein
MTDQHVELFLKWRPGGEAPEVYTWLAKNGLSSLPMKQGLLITGTSDRVEKAFGVSLAGQSLPFEIPVPTELSAHVETIVVPRPRQIYP